MCITITNVITTGSPAAYSTGSPSRGGHTQPLHVNAIAFFQPEEHCSNQA